MGGSGAADAALGGDVPPQDGTVVAAGWKGGTGGREWLGVIQSNFPPNSFCSQGGRVLIGVEGGARQVEVPLPCVASRPPPQTCPAAPQCLATTPALRAPCPAMGPALKPCSLPHPDPKLLQES